MPSVETQPLRWGAYEHEHLERSSDWFWALGVIAVATAVTSVLFGNVLFAILILVAAGTLSVLALRPAPFVEFEISEKGVSVDDTLHTYEEILAFWVDDSASEPLLLVDTTKFMAPNLVIPLGGTDPEAVRTYLREYAQEIPMKEPLAHKILEFFGL